VNDVLVMQSNCINDERNNVIGRSVTEEVYHTALNNRSETTTNIMALQHLIKEALF